MSNADRLLFRPFIGRQIIWTPVFGMCVGGTFRMIGCILAAFDCRRFQGLIGIGKLFDAFLRSICHGRESLRISRLPGAPWPYLAGIFAQLIESRFVSSGSVVRRILSRIWRGCFFGQDDTPSLFMRGDHT